MASMAQKNINEFIITFLTENASEVLDIWNSEENQTQFLNIINNIAKKSKVSGKKKSKKDPNKPKRGNSAYIFFCGETRAKIKEDNPNINARDLTAELGVRWARLKESNKKAVKKYNDMAEADKKRYNKEMESYVPSDESDETNESDKKKKTSKTKKDVSKPKRARSAYIFFCLEQRPLIVEENSELSPKEIMTELSARWNRLKTENETEFQRFTELAQQDKLRYQEEISNSDDSEIKNAKVPKVQKKTKVVETEESSEESSEENKAEEKEEENKAEEKEEENKAEEEEVPKNKKSNKKSNKLTGYIVFCKENRAEVKENNPDMKASEVTKELSKMWKEMDEINKALYIAKANNN